MMCAMAAPRPLTPRARVLRRAIAAVAVLLVLVTAVSVVARSRSGSSLPPVEVSRADVEGTVVLRYGLKSEAAGRRLVQTVVAPKGDVAGRPLLVFLPGKGQDPARLAGDALRAAVAKQGAKAPVVLLPADDGGSYWHDRRSGKWARYVLYEAIPKAIARFGLDPERMAIGGISMGGAGAFALAQDAPGRFCAVGGHSPALWTSHGATAPGAYDDAKDFRRNDPVGRVTRRERQPYRVPLWIDAGREDPFLTASRTFASALDRRGEDVRLQLWSGGHEGRYWQRHMARYLRFYADALAGCERAG